MNLKCRVDQTAAFRAGINAPNSIVILDVDPAALTEQERQAIAVLLVDGHDLTQRSMSESGYQIEPLAQAGFYSHSPFYLKSPDMEGLRAAISDQIAIYERGQVKALERAAEQQAKQEKEQAAMESIRRRFIAGELRLRDEDEKGFGSPHCCASVYPEEGYLFVAENDRIDITPEMQPQIEAYYARRAVAQAAWRAWADKQAAEKAAQEEDERKAADARHKAALTIIETHGSATQKERLKRNLMESPETEARALLTDIVFVPAQLPKATKPTENDIDLSKWEEENPDCPVLPELKRDCEAAKSLTDEQMAEYLRTEAAIKTAIPEATVVPWFLQITRDDGLIPWHNKLVAKATVQRDGFELVRYFEPATPKN